MPHHEFPMEVKRSDMLQWAKNAQLNTEASQTAADSRSVEIRPEAKAEVSVDAMRSKVLSLQQEVRELQTGISMRQIQLGFLNQVNEGSSWQKELKRFMNEQFPAVNLELRSEQSIEDFRSEAGQVVADLKGNLIKKEIQIQNILSAGMFDGPVEGELPLDNSKIMKDFTESREIFNKLRPDAVKSLVN
jgi:hypothetical protein